MPRNKRRPTTRHREREMRSVPSYVRVTPPERSVLVIEADPELQTQMARALRREGHRVVGTSSGDGALALVSQWDVDLIIVNEDLPGRAGIEVTRMIHALKPHVPLVVMSTNAEPSLRAAARAAGAADCLLKPLRVESLRHWLAPLEFETRERRESHEAVAE